MFVFRRPLASTSYLSEDLKHISVRIAEENRAMAERLIRQRANESDAFGFERRRTAGYRLRWELGTPTAATACLARVACH